MLFFLYIKIIDYLCIDETRISSQHLQKRAILGIIFLINSSLFFCKARNDFLSCTRMIATNHICTYSWVMPIITRGTILSRYQSFGFVLCKPLILGGAFRLSTFQTISKKYGKNICRQIRIAYLLIKTSTANLLAMSMLTTRAASAERQRLGVRSCRGAEMHDFITVTSGGLITVISSLKLKQAFNL